MIDQLILKNFKVLRDVSVPLRPLTLVVGPNASGKSSILQSLMLLSQGIRRDDQERYAPELLLSRVSNGPATLACEGHLLDPEFIRERFSLFQFVRPDAVSPLRGRWMGSSFDGVMPENLAKIVGNSLELSLNVKKLAAPSYPREILSVLPGDGDGLAAFLANLYLENSLAFSRLVANLRAVVPVVRGLRLKSVVIQEPGEKRVGYELIFDMHGGEGIPAHSVSQGTLLTLGLLTILSSSNPPGLIVVDDLEQGLHPKALGELVKQIRAIQIQEPHLQIVATSHSPYLLDYLEADEILLTSLDDEGYASVRPLSEHPEYERWKDVMAPGEFWSTVGEKWVTDKAGS